jgi:NADH:ubiquinone reductase (H+-translocating)
MDDLSTAHLESSSAARKSARPQVVIIGAGFGGLNAAKALASAPVDVIVIDRRNYHLFQPLLYQVATAGLSPAEIAMPIRAILRRQRNAKVLLGRVTGIDTRSHLVELGEERIRYDALIVATGARHAYFGHDEWEGVAPGLKKIEDATGIRRNILMAFERAETTANPEERRRLLNFVPHQARVILIEANPRVLVGFPERLSRAAKRALEHLGVEVRVGKSATICDECGVVIADAPRAGARAGNVGAHAGERIEARTILWAAGVAASPAAKWLGAEKDGAGRVIVDPYLTLLGHPEVFVIGDTACAMSKEGRPLPGIAPVAMQQGRYAARVIRARLSSKKAPAPFRYRHIGSLATIGRRSAVADFGLLRLSGRLAWLLWGLVHVLFLIGFRNRVAVLLNWLWAYFTFQRGSRLITGTAAEE